MLLANRTPLSLVTWLIAVVALVFAWVAFSAGTSPCAQAAASCAFDDDAIVAGDLTLNSNTAFDVVIGHAATADAVLSIPDTAGVADTFVMVAQVQTLVGKTLTAPTLTSPILTTSPTAAGATWADLGIVAIGDWNGGTIDGTTIGGSSAGVGTFTTLGATTFTGATIDGLIGSITPAGGSFTTLGATGDITGGNDLLLPSTGAVSFDSGGVQILHDGADGLQFNGASNGYRFNNGNVEIDGDSDGSLYMGESQDSRIYYDGGDLIIDPKVVGSGDVEIQGDVNLLSNDLSNVGNASTDFTSSGASFGVDVDLNSNDLTNIGHADNDITSTGATFGVDVLLGDNIELQFGDNAEATIDGNGSRLDIEADAVTGFNEQGYGEINILSPLEIHDPTYRTAGAGVATGHINFAVTDFIVVDGIVDSTATLVATIHTLGTSGRHSGFYAVNIDAVIAHAVADNASGSAGKNWRGSFAFRTGHNGGIVASAVTEIYESAHVCDNCGARGISTVTFTVAQGAASTDLEVFVFINLTGSAVTTGEVSMLITVIAHDPYNKITFN